MSYVGSAPSPSVVQFSTLDAQSFNGDGTTTAFTLNRAVSIAASIEVTVNNVQQSPYDGSYTVNGTTTLTFSEAPSSGTDNIYVRFLDYPLASITPGNDTVGLDQLSATGTPSSSTYLRGDNSWAAIASSQWTTTGSNIYYNTGSVGIGTSSPAYNLDVGSSSSTTQARVAGSSSGTSLGVLRLSGYRISGDEGSVGAIAFTNQNTTDTTIASIYGYKEGTSATDLGYLVFNTKPTGSAIAERMRITSSGNVGIGLSSPTSKLHVSGGAGTNIGIQSSAGRHWRLGDGVGSTNGNFVIYDYTGSAKRLELDTSGNLLFNSGYGSAATAYGCRAWVNFNGVGTVAIRASGNVSSITDNGTGDYTINFTTAMPDANYSAGTLVGYDNSTNPYRYAGARVWSASSLRINTFYSSGGDTLYDSGYVTVAVFR